MEESSYIIQFERTFLLEKLPAGFDRTSEHFQVLDNHIENTRLCLRTLRAPKTNQYTYILEQKFPRRVDDASVSNVSRMYLSKAEFELFAQISRRAEPAESNEIRFNRYFYEFEGRRFEIEIHLGREARGLILARAYFDSAEEMESFEMPNFATREVTQNRQNVRNR